MPTAKIEAEKTLALQQMHRKRASLEVSLQIANRQLQARNTGADTVIADQAVATMKVIAASVGSQFQALSSSAKRAADGERLFRHEHGINRDLKRPNILMTLFLVMMGWTIETVFTATSLFADGHVDLIAAIGFGATFSSVNVGLGLFAGFVARYLGYAGSRLTSTRSDRIIRRLALIGLLGFVSTHLLMVFTGGRVRVLGGHEGIFDFSEASLAATFGDGLALVIMISAVLSFLIAAAKGYSGITDPIPGYADHAGTASQEIVEQAEAIADDALATLDETFEDAAEDLEEQLTETDHLKDLLKDIATFNSAIDDHKGHIQVLAFGEWEQRCIIAGQELPRPSVDLSAFDALKLAPESLPVDPPQDRLVEALRRSHTEASAAIMTAFTAFSADIHCGVVLPPLSPIATQET